MLKWWYSYNCEWCLNGVERGNWAIFVGVYCVSMMMMMNMRIKHPDDGCSAILVRLSVTTIDMRDDIEFIRLVHVLEIAINRNRSNKAENIQTFFCGDYVDLFLWEHLYSNIFICAQYHNKMEPWTVRAARNANRIAFIAIVRAFKVQSQFKMFIVIFSHFFWSHSKDSIFSRPIPLLAVRLFW